jgi:hypothetical protein
MSQSPCAYAPRTYAPRVGFLVALIAVSVVIRLIPYVAADPTSLSYLWGVSPIFAICLFGGAFFRDRRWAYAVPLASYFASDVLIWLVTGRLDWGFYASQPFIYLGVALAAAIGLLLRRNRSVPAVAGASVCGALVFYLVSNFGLWATGDGSLYPHTVQGLADCYAMAIPFFRNSLLSTLIFAALLFSPLGVRMLEAAADPAPLPARAPRS